MHIIEKAGAQSAGAAFTFVLSTEDVDRMGDVVVQNGINLSAFKKNPVALFAHQQRQPIGTWTNIRQEGGALLADLQLAAHGTSRVIDELRALIEQRILRAASIGFGVIKAEPMNPDEPFGAQRYTKTDLMEASLVAVPANPYALAVRALSPEVRALAFIERGSEPHASHTAAHAAEQPEASRKGKNMTISEKIKAEQERLAKIDKRVGELQAVAESVENISEEHAKEVATLTEERAAITANITNLQALEKLIATRAVPVTGGPVVVTRGAGARNEPAGTLMARMALATVYAMVERKPVEVIARERFGHDQRVEAVMKTAVSVADTTTAGWAKELVAQDVQGFVDMLLPTSVYAGMASRGLVLDFGTFGSISVPYRSGSRTDAAGSFVGENGVIPVKRATIGATVLNRYKMAVISTLTKELTRASTPQAETLIRRFLMDDTSVALDHAFLDNNAAVLGVRPAGITSGIAPIAASAAPGAVDKAIGDLKALVNAMVAAFAGARPVFIMNVAQKLSLAMLYSAGIFIFRDELNNNRLMGIDVITSANVPTGTVYLVDAAAFATGLGAPEFDASDTATLVMANADVTPPTQATLAGDRTALGTAEQVPPDGGISVMDAAQRAAGKAGEGAASISMFQQWGIALRTVLPVSWAMTRPGCVQWIQNVGW